MIFEKGICYPEVEIIDIFFEIVDICIFEAVVDDSSQISDFFEVILNRSVHTFDKSRFIFFDDLRYFFAKLISKES